MKASKHQPADFDAIDEEDDHEHLQISMEEHGDRDSLNSMMEGRLRLLQRHGLNNGPPEGAPLPATRNETRANVRRRLTYLLRESLVPELSPVQNAVKLLQQLKDKLALDKTDAASIDYAINVLYRDRDYIHVPEALQVNQEDDHTHQWLQHTFTRAVHPVAALMKNEFSHSAGRARAKSHWVQLPYTATAEKASAITAVLSKADTWEFDILELREVTGGRELQTLGWHLLHNVYGFVVGDPTVWTRWLQWVESAYLTTDYHNATHAADVLQTVHFFLCSGVRSLFSSTQLLALLLAAIVHDLGHDGLNNGFHKESMSERAVAHNDRSVQENYHVSLAFSHSFAHPSLNIFALLDRRVMKELRSLMITLVLATDMSFHFEHLATFKKMFDAHGMDYASYPASEIPHIMCMLLHAADISNPAKPIPLAKHWAGLVVKEFFNQGAQEKELGLPVSPNCDPASTAMEQVQIGFIRFIVLPFFTELSGFLPLVAQRCLPSLHANLAYWQSVAKTEAEKRGGGLVVNGNNNNSSSGSNGSNNSSSSGGGGSRRNSGNLGHHSSGSRRNSANSAGLATPPKTEKKLDHANKAGGGKQRNNSDNAEKNDNNNKARSSHSPHPPHNNANNSDNHQHHQEPAKHHDKPTHSPQRQPKKDASEDNSKQNTTHEEASSSSSSSHKTPQPPPPHKEGGDRSVVLKVMENKGRRKSQQKQQL